VPQEQGSADSGLHAVAGSSPRKVRRSDEET
jgi:hypothetical protein